MKSKRKSAAPLVVRRGSVQVRIYTVTRKSGIQKGEQFYQVADYSTGPRRLISFADLEEAKTNAERIAALMSRGETYAAGFGAEDRALYGRATEMLKAVGIPLEIAVSDYVEILKMLGGKSQRLSEAAQFFIQRNPGVLPEKTVAQAVEELIKSKQARKASSR